MRNGISAISATLKRFPLSVIQLGMRVGIAAMFFRSGLLKFNSWEFALLLFRDEYQVPLIDPVLAARLTTALELGLPIFLLMGVATRLATLPLLGMVAVIQFFIYPNAWSDHLIWASILVLLLTRGPGRISIDYLIAKRIGPASGPSLSPIR
jgi:putative oxidoreductase